MKYSKHALIVLAGAIALIAAVASIGWWMTSPENLRKSVQAVLLLAGTICSLQHTRRFPKGSPLLLCAAIAGLGFPFLVASAGQTFTTGFAVLVVLAWTGIGIARVHTPSRTSVERSR